MGSALTEVSQDRLPCSAPSESREGPDLAFGTTLIVSPDEEVPQPLAASRRSNASKSPGAITK